MAQQPTIQELERFVETNMPKNSELELTPFLIFYDMVISYLANVPNKLNLTKLVSTLYGEEEVTKSLPEYIESILGDTTYQGSTLVGYIGHVQDKLTIKSYNTLQDLYNAVLNDRESLRILKKQPDNSATLYLYDEADSTWIRVGGLTPEDSDLIFTSIEDLYNKHEAQEVSLGKKYDKPLAPNNTTSYILLGNGSTMKVIDVPNIFNTDGTTTADRTLKLGGILTFDINGKQVIFKGLEDKSADNSFDKIIGLNTLGQTGKVDGVSMFMNLPSKLNDTQRNIWKTGMNGGWTTNTMSISDIFPPILKLQNQNSYISVKGANLNLNPANFSVSICANNSTAINPIILAVIPNNQVTLISPTDFAFYYNFNTLGEGEFKLLLSNGVASYLSTYTFILKNQVDNIDLGAILWNTKILNDATTNNMQAGGSGVLFRADAAVAPLADDPQPLFKAKTANPLFNAGDDFYLEFNINFNNITGNNSSSFAFGISASSDDQTLINDLSHFLSMTLVSGQFVTNVTDGKGTTVHSQSVKVIMIKRGTYLLQQSNFAMNGGITFQQRVKTISDSNDWYFGATFQNMDATNKTFNISIVSAYKF